MLSALTPHAAARLLLLAKRRVEMRAAWDSNQPRDPAGTSTGGQWTNGFNAQDKRAIDEYVGNVDPPKKDLYVPDGMNALLRGRGRYSGQVEHYTPEQESYYRQQIDHFQQAIKKTVTEKDQTFYRGVTSPLSEQLTDGVVFVDKGFTSITNNRTIAEERFTGFGQGHGRVFEVRVPKGTALLDVDRILNPTNDKEYTTEGEHVLGHGTRFRVKRNVLQVIR